MKVIIVGASSAGLYLAYSLAREGLEVEVYERKERIDWPRRTLIVTSRLADILGFEVGEAILNRVSYMQLEAGGEKVKLKLGSPDLIIERGKFFALLADMARREGARLYFGYELVGFSWVNGGRGKIGCLVRGRLSGEVREVEADYLIGADGALSRVKGLLFGAEGLNTWMKPGWHGAKDEQEMNSAENGGYEIGENSGENQNRSERQNPEPGIDCEQRLNYELGPDCEQKLNSAQSLSSADSLNDRQNLNSRKNLRCAQGLNGGQSLSFEQSLRHGQNLDNSQRLNSRQSLSCESLNSAQGFNGAQRLNFLESILARFFSLESRQKSNGKNFASDLKALLQWRVELKGMRERGSSFRFEPDTCYVWFDPEQTPYFFWALPESDEVMAVGLIAERMAEAKKALASFLEEKMPGARPLEIQAGLTPLPRFVFRFSNFLFLGRGASWRFSCRPENLRSQAGDGAEDCLRPENSVRHTEIKNDFELNKLRDRVGGESNHQESLDKIVLNRHQNGAWGDSSNRRVATIDGHIYRNFYSSKEILYSSMGGGDGLASIFLVGDAASQVKATTVGGVVAGLRGAKAVASLILGRVEEAKRELERLRCELNLHLLLRKILNRFGTDDYRRLLSLLRQDNELASFICRHTRDDLASFFFKLLLRYPRLAWLGLRSLLPKW